MAPADPRLWIVVLIDDPDAAVSSASRPAVAGLSDGSTMIIDLVLALPGQNAIRVGFGLPPLPDLSTVTHGSPAVDVGGVDVGVTESSSDPP